MPSHRALNRNKRRLKRHGTPIFNLEQPNDIYIGIERKRQQRIRNHSGLLAPQTRLTSRLVYSDATTGVERLPYGVRPAPPHTAIEYFYEALMDMFPLATSRSESSRRNLEESVDAAWRVLPREEKDQYEFAEMRDLQRFNKQQIYYESSLRKKEEENRKINRIRLKKEDILRKDEERRRKLNHREKEKEIRISEFKERREAKLKEKKEEAIERKKAVERRRKETELNNLRRKEERRLFLEKRRNAVNTKTKKTEQRIEVNKKIKNNITIKSHSELSINSKVIISEENLKRSKSCLSKIGHNENTYKTKLNEYASFKENIASRTRSALMKIKTNNINTTLDKSVRISTPEAEKNEINESCQNSELDSTNDKEILSNVNKCNGIEVKHNDSNDSSLNQSTIENMPNNKAILPSTDLKTLTSHNVVSTKIGAKRPKRRPLKRLQKAKEQLTRNRKAKVKNRVNIANKIGNILGKNRKISSSKSEQSINSSNNSSTESSSSIEIIRNKFTPSRSKSVSISKSVETFKELPKGTVQRAKNTVTRTMKGIFNYVSETAKGISESIMFPTIKNEKVNQLKNASKNIDSVSSYTSEQDNIIQNSVNDAIRKMTRDNKIRVNSITPLKRVRAGKSNTKVMKFSMELDMSPSKRKHIRKHSIGDSSYNDSNHSSKKIVNTDWPSDMSSKSSELWQSSNVRSKYVKPKKAARTNISSSSFDKQNKLTKATPKLPTPRSPNIKKTKINSRNPRTPTRCDAKNRSRSASSRNKREDTFKT